MNFAAHSGPRYLVVVVVLVVGSAEPGFSRGSLVGTRPGLYPGQLRRHPAHASLQVPKPARRERSVPPRSRPRRRIPPRPRLRRPHAHPLEAPAGPGTTPAGDDRVGSTGCGIPCSREPTSRQRSMTWPCESRRLRLRPPDECPAVAQISTGSSQGPGNRGRRGVAWLQHKDVRYVPHTWGSLHREYAAKPVVGSGVRWGLNLAPSGPR